MKPASFFIQIVTEDYGPKVGKEFSDLFPDPSVEVSYTDAMNKLDKILLGDSKPRTFKASPCNSRRFRFTLAPRRAPK